MWPLGQAVAVSCSKIGSQLNGGQQMVGAACDGGLRIVMKYLELEVIRLHSRILSFLNIIIF